MKRININSQQTHFIGCWNLENNDLCNEIINLFENNKNLQQQGVTDTGKNPKIKKTTDIKVRPNDLKKPKFEILKKYFNELHKCFLDYQNQWPFLKSMLKTVHVPSFTYLNDVDDGGQTNFDHYKIKIKPEIGKTLIWPAEWTHAHTGEILKSGKKYIVTGWMHFPTSDEEKNN